MSSIQYIDSGMLSMNIKELNVKTCDMTTIILIALYIGHIFLSRRLCKLAYKNGFKNISYDLWWSWFIPLAGILWAALDYTVSLRDIPEEQRKMKRNWFTGKDW